AAASQFPGGQTCHAAFKVGRDGNRISASKLFDSTVGLIVTDEISMLGGEFAVKMDKRLRLVYDPDLPFGGKSLLLSGDFWQLEALMGTPLCKTMYKPGLSEVLTHARDLFRRFRVFFVETQQRAHDCPLTKEEVEKDPEWMDETTILVTSNVDKAALTSCFAKLLATRLLELLYNDKDYPNLFGYFGKGGNSQILDNGNENVEWEVANGTMCKMVSLAWTKPENTEAVLDYLNTISAHAGDVIDLPYAPDYVNVQLVTLQGDVVPATTWPPQNNLETNWILDKTGRKTQKFSIIIPIGLVAHNKEKYTVKLARTLIQKQIEIKYEQVAVELALVMTIWKAQGATLRRVLLYLEGIPGAPKWLFDHIYVGTSRVRLTRLLRCLPPSPGFRKKRLKRATAQSKWVMDIGEDGYWRLHKQSN
ncbi:PIF1-like helicase, partial [Phytophthora infestans]